MNDGLLKAYFEPVRRRMNDVFLKRDGWTPCPHYEVCIGWCPECLALKSELARLNEIYGEP